MMALLFELVTSVVGLALKPVLLAKLSCQFGVRSIYIVIQTWLELLRFAFCLHFLILWRIAIWSMAVLSLPVRAFTALYRERLVIYSNLVFLARICCWINLFRTVCISCSSCISAGHAFVGDLEMQLNRLKNEMENLHWDRKELEEQLLVAIKERKMMEMMLMELEEEHDEAIVKIELLEGEVQDLKDETHRLKEVQGKALWSYWDQENMGTYCNNKGADNVRKSSCKPDYNKNVRQVAEDHEMDDVRKSGSKFYGLSQPYVTDLISNKGNSLAEQSKAALSRSLFSAILSLVVGVAVWEAEDRCMPLVVALSTVVTISLVSVLRLFTRIEHKPASKAVVLLSINWFILGTLASPMLPSVAHFIGPLALGFLRRTFKLLAL